MDGTAVVLSTDFINKRKQWAKEEPYREKEEEDEEEEEEVFQQLWSFGCLMNAQVPFNRHDLGTNESLWDGCGGW